MSMRSCKVSRAQLTCDPGDSTTGYNSVVAVIRFTAEVDSELFVKAFIASTIDSARQSPLTMGMSFSCGYMKWKDMGPKWTPRDNIVITNALVSDVEALVSRELSVGIDLSKPCWSLNFLESVIENGGEKCSVCILKYHHVLADGFTMIQQMMGKMVPSADSSRSIVSLFPQKSVNPVVKKSVLKSVFSLLKMSPDKPSTLRSKRLRVGGDSVNVVLSNVLSVARIKELSAKLGVSINDLLTSAFSIALSSICTEDVSTVVWVSLNRDFGAPIHPGKWDNSTLGFGYIKLPLSAKTPSESLALCMSRLNTLKQSPDPGVINGVLKCLGSVPLCIGKFVAGISADKASMSMSNLVGPRERVCWPTSDSGSGWEVQSVYFATSPPFRFGPLISIISYDNVFCVSMAARSDMLSAKELHRIVDTELVNAVVQLEDLPLDVCVNTITDSK